MKRNINKLTSIAVSAVAIMNSGVVNAVEVSNNEIHMNENSNLLRENTYIDATHSGTYGFDKTITTDKTEGENLNIWVKNNGSAIVTVKITFDNSRNYEYNVSSGSSGTYSFGNMAAMNHKVRIYITNRDGSKYDLDVRARQF